MGKPIKAKKRCCKSGPRCKRCPVVLERLRHAGYAERTAGRRYMIGESIPKKKYKRARAR